MKMKSLNSMIFVIFMLIAPGYSEELPIPNYNNSVIASIEHNIFDTSEVNYIKDNFNFGLYVWLSFSRTHIDPVLAWHSDWDNASEGIQSFKDSVNTMIEEARKQNVRLHLVLCAGLARGLSIYREAKEEDIRNAQWYNDNKLASDSQITDSAAFNKYVFGALSRYARKVSGNLEAKAKAALDFLKQRMDEEPDVLIALSGWGESELNFHRMDPSKNIQDYFCDYSPFAVLEFRDWICHTGMYDDTGKYKGEGYSEGGAKYQGTSGLNRFNMDFGTSFTTWDLKYFNWSLEDDYDENPVDSVNNDPNRIPFSDYSHGNMMPTSGSNYIPGGFDPSRTMEPGDKFWDLWNLFRETMVHNYVKDMAKWASEAGIHQDRWYSHQIPGDYLFGTNPDMKNKNARYYLGASPLWTADILPYGLMGATIYDIKFPDWFARTTIHALPAISAMSPKWAIMEYDPETYPLGFDVTESSVDFILDQYLNIYDYKVHLINFWRWWDKSGEHRIKGMNKEKALKNFIQKIRDKARRKDLNIVFDPPEVVDFIGRNIVDTGEIQLEVSGVIWRGHPWEWKDWGDFSHFEIYRGDEPNFPADSDHLLANTEKYIYKDTSTLPGKYYYYKIRAVNSKGVPGPFSKEIKLPSYILSLFAGEGGTTDPKPGIYSFDPGTEVTIKAIPDLNYMFYGWSGDASGTTNPIAVIMDLFKSIAANFEKTSVYQPLNFRGKKMLNRSFSQAEYINVLTWEANPKNKNIIKYRIYQIEGENNVLPVELDSDTFEYWRRRVVKDKQYVYSIVAVNDENRESDPAIVDIK